MAVSSQLNNALIVALSNQSAATEFVGYINDILDGTYTITTFVSTSATITTLTGTDATLTGTLTLSSGADLAFSGTTGTNEIWLTDNLADALSVKIAGGADLLVAITTDNSESLKILSAATQKLGFFGVTAVVQGTAYTQTAYATADKTVANITTTSPSTTLVLSGTNIAAKTPSLTLTDAVNTNAGTVATSLDQAQKDIGTAFNTLRVEVAALVADLADVKQALNSVIDDLQAFGLVA
jgi:hypothetical protein